MTNVEQIAEETDCVPAYISKGIAMACFYYARCLHHGRSTKKDENEAKFYYSKVSVVYAQYDVFFFLPTCPQSTQ